MIYFTDSIFPSCNADSIQTAKTVEALNKQGLDTSLVAISSQEKEGVSSEHIVKLFRRRGFKGFLYVFPFLAKSYVPRKSKIYSRHLFSAVFFSMLNYEVYYEVHNTYWSSSPLPRFIIRAAFARIKGFISITNALKQRLLDDFTCIDSDDVLVASDASDINTLVRTTRLTVRLQIVYTGSFKEGKGVELIIAIANDLPMHDFHLYGGPITDSQKHSIPANVRLHGYVAHQEIPQILVNADIALLPNQRNMYTGKKSGSIGDFTSPMKLFDYMAAGVCILSSELPVLREILDDDIAYLLDAQDKSVWCQTISSLAEDRDKLREKGEAVKQRFESLYTWDIRASNIINFIA